MHLAQTYLVTQLRLLPLTKNTNKSKTSPLTKNTNKSKTYPLTKNTNKITPPPLCTAPPPLRCVSLIAPSFFALPAITLERRGASTSTPATGRISSKVFLSSSADDDIEKFLAVHLFRWRCRRGKNCLHYETTKHLSL